MTEVVGEVVLAGDERPYVAHPGIGKIRYYLVEGGVHHLMVQVTVGLLRIAQRILSPVDQDQGGVVRDGLGQPGDVLLEWSGRDPTQGFELVGKPGEPRLVHRLSGVPLHQAIAHGRIGHIGGELVPRDYESGLAVPVEPLGVVGEHAEHQDVVVRCHHGGRPVGVLIDHGQPVHQHCLCLRQADRGQAEGLGVPRMDERPRLPGMGELGGDVPSEEVGCGAQVTATDDQYPATAFGAPTTGTPSTGPSGVISRGPVVDGDPVDCPGERGDHFAHYLEFGPTEPVIEPLLDAHVEHAAREEVVGQDSGSLVECVEATDPVVAIAVRGLDIPGHHLWIGNQGGKLVGGEPPLGEVELVRAQRQFVEPVDLFACVLVDDHTDVTRAQEVLVGVAGLLAVGQFALEYLVLTESREGTIFFADQLR